MQRSLLVLALFGVLNSVPCRAQDTTLFIQLVDQHAKPGDTVYIPVLLTLLEDSLAGYNIEFTLSQPDVIEFRDEMSVDASQTLSENWGFVDGTVLGPTFIEATGIYQDTIQGPGSPIEPVVVGEVLIKLIAFVPCRPDPFSDQVDLVPTNFCGFSNPQGQLIEPWSAATGTVTIDQPVRGDIDQSGYFDVIDVLGTINCAFRDNCSGCGPVLADVNCSGAVDIVDVVAQVDFIFRGGSLTFCI